eukprot:jgi/Chlat1/987/Chrsp108S01414
MAALLRGGRSLRQAAAAGWAAAGPWAGLAGLEVGGFRVRWFAGGPPKTVCVLPDPAATLERIVVEKGPLNAIAIWEEARLAGFPTRTYMKKQLRFLLNQKRVVVKADWGPDPVAVRAPNGKPNQAKAEFVYRMPDRREKQIARRAAAAAAASSDPLSIASAAESA